MQCLDLLVLRLYTSTPGFPLKHLHYCPKTTARFQTCHRDHQREPTVLIRGCLTQKKRVGNDFLWVTPGGRCQISQTHQTGERAFPPWLIQWQSRGGGQAGERSAEIKNDRQSGETDHSLFFCPLYCWAFFFCLGTDWGISLLPERRQSDERRWELRNKKANVGWVSYRLRNIGDVKNKLSLTWCK